MDLCKCPLVLGMRFTSPSPLFWKGALGKHSKSVIWKEKLKQKGTCFLGEAAKEHPRFGRVFIRLRVEQGWWSVGICGWSKGSAMQDCSVGTWMIWLFGGFFVIPVISTIIWLYLGHCIEDHYLSYQKNPNNEVLSALLKLPFVACDLFPFDVHCCFGKSE